MRSFPTPRSVLCMTRLERLGLRVVEEWAEEVWIPRTCSRSCSAEGEDSLVVEVEVSLNLQFQLSCLPQADDLADLDEERISFTGSPSRSKTFTRVKFRS